MSVAPLALKVHFSQDTQERPSSSTEDCSSSSQISSSKEKAKNSWDCKFQNLEKEQLIQMLVEEKKKGHNLLAAFSRETETLRLEIQRLRDRIDHIDHFSPYRTKLVQTKSVKDMQFKESTKNKLTNSFTQPQIIPSSPSSLHSISFSNADISKRMTTSILPSSPLSSKKVVTCPSDSHLISSNPINILSSQTKKLLEFLEDLVIKCSPSETFSLNEKPTERHIWKFIKSMTEEYVAMKKQQVSWQSAISSLTKQFKTSSLDKIVQLSKLQSEELFLLRKKLYYCEEQGLSQQTS